MKYQLREPIEAQRYTEGLEDGFLYKVFNKEGKKVTTLKPDGSPQTDEESLSNLAGQYEAEGYSVEKVPFVITRSGSQNDLNSDDYIVTDPDGLKRVVSKEHFEAHHEAVLGEWKEDTITVGVVKPEDAPVPAPEPEGKPESESTTENDPHATEHPKDEAQPVDVIGKVPLPKGEIVPEIAHKEHEEQQSEPQPDSTPTEETPKGKSNQKAKPGPKGKSK